MTSMSPRSPSIPPGGQRDKAISAALRSGFPIEERNPRRCLQLDVFLPPHHLQITFLVRGLPRLGIAAVVDDLHDGMAIASEGTRYQISHPTCQPRHPAAYQMQGSQGRNAATSLEQRTLSGRMASQYPGVFSCVE